MRKDSTVDIALIILYLITLAFALRGAVRGGADGPLWEARWLGLDAAGRARIATAAHSRDAREELRPEEADLVSGYQRRRRRRSAYVELAGSPFLIVAAAFALTGALGTRPFTLIFSVFIVVSGLVNYLRERRMDGKLREVVEAERSSLVPL
jgi:hypothetical protein